MSILPTPAPPDPMPVVRAWLDDAVDAGLRNHDAIALATTDGRGRPSVRMVLMRGLSVEEGYAVFFTHYGSRKAVELEQSGHGAAAIYWEPFGRQIRFEGPVVRSPAAESDAYFARRPRPSQLNAWVSRQSAPLSGADDLERRARAKADEFDANPQLRARSLPRPPDWGGYRLWFRAIELWAEGLDRFHDRIRYERELAPQDDYAFSAGAWRSERLQP